MKIKVNDVYSFRYKPEYLKEKQISEPYWCFDGQLIVIQRKYGLVLEDTYWSSDNKKFTLEEALKIGELTFKCNLDDVEKISKNDLKYYDEKDIIDLSYQHHCYDNYAKKKGAEKNKDVIKQYINDSIEHLKHEIKYKSSQIKNLENDLIKIEEGKINEIYL